MMGCYKVILDCSKENIRESSLLSFGVADNLWQLSTRNAGACPAMHILKKSTDVSLFRFKHKEFQMVRYMADPPGPPKSRSTSRL